MAYAMAGDISTARALLACTRRHRHDDGSYFTGLVYPDRITFPDRERTAYSGAAVILAADLLTGASSASGLFLGHGLPAIADEWIEDGRLD